MYLSNDDYILVMVLFGRSTLKVLECNGTL